MRCQGMKYGPVMRKTPTGTVVSSYLKHKNCGRQASVFFRITYSELWRWTDNGIYEDVLGFCDECARGKDKPGGYNKSSRERTVLRVRGVVSGVAPDDGSTLDGDKHNRRMHDGKRELLKIMSYKGNQDLADDWEEIMAMAIREFTVRTVMDK